MFAPSKPSLKYKVNISNSEAAHQIPNFEVHIEEGGWVHKYPHGYK